MMMIVTKRTMVLNAVDIQMLRRKLLLFSKFVIAERDSAVFSIQGVHVVEQAMAGA